MLSSLVVREWKAAGGGDELGRLLATYLAGGKLDGQTRERLGISG